MLTFNSFISEMAVSQGNLNKALSIIKRYFERKLTTKFYRYGGPEGTTTIAHGFGVLYFYDKTKAIRFNYIKGSIASITLWKAYKLGQKGDLTIELGGLNVMQATKEILNTIKTHKTGVFQKYAEEAENDSLDLITEAKRITPHEFYDLVNSSLKQSERLDAVTWNRISEIAILNDRQIPGAVKSTRKKLGKGNYVYDLTKMLDNVKNPDKVATKVEPTYYIKVTAQDPESKKFLSVKDDKKAAQMLKTIDKAIKNPDIKTEIKDPNTLFGILHDLVTFVAGGGANSLLVYGGAGTGKTHTVQASLADAGKHENKDYFKVTGKISPAAFYQHLYMHRHGKIILFDDTDSVWKDSDIVNAIKAATDTKDVRTLSWINARTLNVSKMSKEDKAAYEDKVDLQLETDPSNPLKLPSEFSFTGRIMFISNMERSKFDSAILSRGPKIDMTLTPDEMFYRIESILEHLGDPNSSIEDKKTILTFLKDRYQSGVIDNLSMRTFIKAEKLAMSGIPNWERMLDYV